MKMNEMTINSLIPCHVYIVLDYSEGLGINTLKHQIRSCRATQSKTMDLPLQNAAISNATSSYKKASIISNEHASPSRSAMLQVAQHRPNIDLKSTVLPWPFSDAVEQVYSRYRMTWPRSSPLTGIFESLLDAVCFRAGNGFGLSVKTLHPCVCDSE